jgi:hypothetical protein
LLAGCWRPNPAIQSKVATATYEEKPTTNVSVNIVGWRPEDNSGCDMGQVNGRKIE